MPLTIPKEKIIDFQKEALLCAKAAYQENEVPIGAVITDGQSIISKGWNQTEKFSDPTMHAEIIAIKNASKVLNNWRLDNLAIFVTVEPCTMCAGAILNSRLSLLVFGACEPLTGAVGSKYDLFASNLNTRVIRSVLEDDCKFLMEDFFKNRRANLF